MENILNILNATLPWRVRWYHEGGEMYDEGAIVEFNFQGHSKQKMNCDVMLNSSLKSVGANGDEEEEDDEEDDNKREKLWKDPNRWSKLPLNQCLKYWRCRVGVLSEFNAWHVAKVRVDGKWVVLDDRSLLPSNYRNPKADEVDLSPFIQKHSLEEDDHYKGIYLFSFNKTFNK